MYAEVFLPTGEKGEAEKNERWQGVRQIKLYPQSGLMVIHSIGLSDKGQGQEVQGRKGRDRTRKNAANGQTRD